MEIVFKSYHGIDVINNCSTRRDISEDFDRIIETMLEKIFGNPSVRRYKTETDRAVVANIIKDVLKIEPEEAAMDSFNIYSDEIATRLLREEKKTHERMEHLNGVQRGSLVQALIKNDEGKFKYFIAKVEHSKYVDEIELILKGGFNPEENKIWKTCIFSCFVEEDEIEVSEARIFLNNRAVYWTQDFLELVELKSDEKNTRDAWKGIEDVLTKELKKNAASDYFTLRNAVITYFRRPRTIVYDDLITEIFLDYEPIDTNFNKIEEIKNKLLKLPETNSFDSNFNSKPKEVKAKIKSVHKVNKDIDIIIREGISENISNYKNIIHAEMQASGERVIVISATEDATFRMFNLNR